MLPLHLKNGQNGKKNSQVGLRVARSGPDSTDHNWLIAKLPFPSTFKINTCEFYSQAGLYKKQTI